MAKVFCVYITTNKPYGTLYTGMSGNLPVRTIQHKEKMADGFTKKYNLSRLVYYETHETAEAVAHREKCIKEWKRD